MLHRIAQLSAVLVTTVAISAGLVAPPASGSLPKLNSEAENSSAACFVETNRLASSVTESRSLKSSVVTSGKVQNAAGRSPVSGARVLMLAWPGRDLNSLADGESFSLTPVGRAITKPDGSYVMRVDPKINLSRFTSDNGTVDVSIWVGESRGAAAHHRASLSLDKFKGNRALSAHETPFQGNLTSR